nr:hypothetical protein BaRGS_019824 [Batillaria attramentaria]
MPRGQIGEMVDVEVVDSGRWSPKPGESSGLMEAKEVEHLLRTLHDVRIHLNLANKIQLVEVITKDIATYMDNCDLLVHTLVSLAILLSGDKALQEQFSSHHLDLFLEMLFDHTADMTLVLKCFRLLHILASTASVRPVLVQRGVLPRVYHCMKVWQAEVCVVEHCVHLLMLLCQEDMVVQELVDKGIIMETLVPEMMSKADSADLQLDPVHTLCLGAILMYEYNADVFTAAASAIFYLTADNDTLCEIMWEKNTYIAIVEGMRHHQDDPHAVCAACRALRGLCIFNEHHKEVVARYDGDVLKLLATVLTDHPKKGSIQTEAIITIACLADIDMIRHQCFVLHVHKLILQAMDTFPGDDVLQEASIEALAVLGGAASGAEVLHSLNAVNKILLCLKRFTYNINIQKKGLMAIQVLVDPRLLQSATTCSDLVDVLKTAMHNFPDKVTLQKEAVVAMQILAERGLDGEKRGLHDLASECLYVIGIEQDLKSRMLVAACSKGYISGVECLIEIGAEVNTGQGEDTPLYCAVKNRDTNMVRLLLRQEIRDVQGPLKLSLKQESHEITGMLLSLIGQDREMGKLLWGGYGLHDLRPEWLLPSLSANNTQHAYSKTPVFQYSVDEWGDWKQTTLTGANIPFSPTDPRQPATLTSSLATPERALRKPPGKWLRKYSQGPLSPSDLPIQMVEFKRNLSYDLSPAEYQITSLLHLVSGGAEFVERLSTLQQLDLGNNMLDSLPAELFQVGELLPSETVAAGLMRLHTLRLSNNALSEKDPFFVPKFILELPNLRVLDLVGNRLEGLPPPTQWKTQILKELLVSQNNITKLNLEGAKAWSKLEKLHLARNKISEMPFDGLNLDLDVKITGGRVQDLRIYLHNRLKKAQDYYRMKLMVVGFERQRNGKSVTYTLSTWDFAGQEDFYSTHQCFLTNRTLYLVVYDISLGMEEVEKLKPWLSNIQARAPGCPVIIVDTREEVLASFDAKLKDLALKAGFPKINCSAIVDLKKETPELERLRKKVFEIVDEYKVKGKPVMGQKVPASYVKLAELLSGEVSNVEKSFPVIRHAQLTRIIRNEHLDLDEDELKQAVSFLHESGVLLHYDETTLQMRDFYFINPGWLCRMMAQVVTVPEINPFINRDGVMKRNSAYMLFTGKTIPGGPNFIFPPSLIPQYLHLLEKFEIALPRNDDELLIPCRLPIMKPPFSMPQLARKDMAYRYYSMPYVPIGFWSRLLTRLIVFAQSKFIKNLLMLGTEPAEVRCWQEGLFVMWKQDAFFLVDGCRGDTEEVHVTVPASSQGARLLGYLVDHVDSLVDEWYPGHLFLFDDLVSQSETCDTVFCPQHDADVSLAQLAPDIMLTDIETNFRLDLDSFEFKDSPENLLGGGGFGSVYKATYKGQATIMRRLKHPSVVSLVAVAQRPHFLMVMEFAPCGSLAHVLHTQVSLSRSLQHKIILQVGSMNYLRLVTRYARLVMNDARLVICDARLVICDARLVMRYPRLVMGYPRLVMRYPRLVMGYRDN